MLIKLTERSLSAIEPPADAAQLYVWDTELTGFGVVVGRTGVRTFVARAWVGRKKRRVKIGIAGRVRDDGHHWTVTLARQRAKELLGDMAAGVDPNAAKHGRAAGGPTLRDGLALHVSNMRKGNRSVRSIETIESEVPRLMPTWLDRPIAELRGADLVALHDQLTSDGKTYLANRLVAHVSAVWNALDRVHELAGRNPARAVTRNRYVPKRERVADADLPGWWVKVQALSPVRRDLQTFVLFTGMRSEAARYVRWEHLDEERGALVVPKPKGGEARAFTLPVPRTILDMLRRRRDENAIVFETHGGDGGWVFPTLTRSAPFRVIPVSEPKEYRETEDGSKTKILPGMHALRRTYLSVATEAGVGELDRHVLANHAFGRQSVNASYILQGFSHLAACQARIEAALLVRILPADTGARPGSHDAHEGNVRTNIEP